MSTINNNNKVDNPIVKENITLEDYLYTVANSKPLTYKQIKELNKSKTPTKFPYEETVEKLNKLPNTKLQNIPTIIHQAELSVYKKVGIKKLYNMVKNPNAKKYIKEYYKL